MSSLFSNKTFAVLTAVGAAGAAVSVAWMLKKKLNVMRKVAEVKSLTIYPVKCCGGVDVDEVFITKHGGVVDPKTSVMDRSFMLIDTDHRNFDAKRLPAVRGVRVRVEPGCLYLYAADVGELRVSLPVQVDEHSITYKCTLFNRRLDTIDCGEEAAAWVSRLTSHSGARLVHLPAQRLQWGPAEDPKVVKFKVPFKDDMVALQNLGPVNMLSQESLDDAASNMPEGMELSRDNFRPNIVISGVSKPYAEDGWKESRLGTALLYLARPCSRCPQTTVVPDRSVEGAPRYKSRADQEPLTTLSKIRMNTTFMRPTISVDLGVLEDGRVRVGDAVYA